MLRFLGEIRRDLLRRRSQLQPGLSSPYYSRVLEQFTRQLVASNALTDEQVRVAVERLVDEAVPAATKADFLTHLALKGETTAEIAAFARELRARWVRKSAF